MLVGGILFGDSQRAQEHRRFDRLKSWVFIDDVPSASGYMCLCVMSVECKISKRTVCIVCGGATCKQGKTKTLKAALRPKISCVSKTRAHAYASRVNPMVEIGRLDGMMPSFGARVLLNSSAAILSQVLCTKSWENSSNAATPVQDQILGELQ